jgi:hypothetical protein
VKLLNDVPHFAFNGLQFAANMLQKWRNGSTAAIYHLLLHNASHRQHGIQGLVRGSVMILMAPPWRCLGLFSRADQCVLAFGSLIQDGQYCEATFIIFPMHATCRRTTDQLTRPGESRRNCLRICSLTTSKLLRAYLCSYRRLAHNIPSIR